MSGFEEETYSTIFSSLKHSVRRKILRMLSEKPRNFSEILEALEISSSHLTYHLENLGELVSKTEKGKYNLSRFGEAAVETMSKVEEAPKVTEIRSPLSLSIKWKSFFVVLMIGLIVLAGMNYAQYLSLNRLSAEYEELKELVDLVFEGATLQSEHTLTYKAGKFEFDGDYVEGVVIESWLQGPQHCVIYNPYDAVTLHLVLSLRTNLSESYVPISVRKGNAFDLRTNEAAPVVWSANATASSAYSVSLFSEGWYTISLFGRKITLSTFEFWIPLENIDCSLSLRIIYKGNYSPFIVKPR